MANHPNRSRPYPRTMRITGQWYDAAGIATTTVTTPRYAIVQIDQHGVISDPETALYGDPAIMLAWDGAYLTGWPGGVSFAPRNPHVMPSVQTAA